MLLKQDHNANYVMSLNSLEVMEPDTPSKKNNRFSPSLNPQQKLRQEAKICQCIEVFCLN